MKTEKEIRNKFDELVKQRDDSMARARDVLNQRIRALAWVLNRQEVSDLLLDEELKKLMECVS